MRKVLMLVTVLMFIGGIAWSDDFVKRDGANMPIVGILNTVTDTEARDGSDSYYPVPVRTLRTLDVHDSGPILPTEMIDGNKRFEVRECVGNSISTTATLLEDFASTVLSTDTTLTVVSTSYADSDASGTGAQVIRVYASNNALDTYAWQDIVLRGTTVNTGTVTAQNIEKIQVFDIGSLTYNLGTISVRNSYLSETYAEIGTTNRFLMKFSSSRHGVITGRTLYLKNVSVYNYDETEACRVFVCYSDSTLTYARTKKTIDNFEVRPTELITYSYPYQFKLTGPGILEVYAQAIGTSANVVRLYIKYEYEEVW